MLSVISMSDFPILVLVYCIPFLFIGLLTKVRFAFSLTMIGRTRYASGVVYTFIFILLFVASCSSSTVDCSIISSSTTLVDL